MEERFVGRVRVELRPVDPDGLVFNVSAFAGGRAVTFHFDVPAYVRRKHGDVLSPDFVDEVAALAVMSIVAGGGVGSARVEKYAEDFSVRRGRLRPNPSAPAAEKLYREFHQNEPRRVGSFGPSFRIPARARAAGDALEVLYRSDKRDPATGRQPRKPVDYIHEHDPGVRVYRTDGMPDTDVPEYIAKATELVLLGECLGFAYHDEESDQEVEAQVRTPYPELYAVPSGKGLLVVQSKRSVLAVIWGGRLGVEARGIVH